MSHKTHNPTKHALIFIIRGMNYDWKQPISYYLISNSCTCSILNNILISTIRKLNSINTHVKAFITDQGQIFKIFLKTIMFLQTNPTLKWSMKK